MSDSDAIKALRLFIETVNATGGLVGVDGEFVPAADEEWLDLSNAYLSACEALGVEPVINEPAENDDYRCSDPAGPDCHDDRCFLHYGDIGDPDDDSDDEDV